MGRRLVINVVMLTATCPLPIHAVSTTKKNWLSFFKSLQIGRARIYSGFK